MARKYIIESFDQVLADTSANQTKQQMFSYMGCLYPTTICSPETFQALQSFEARADDMILSGYPKTGEWLSFAT